MDNLKRRGSSILSTSSHTLWSSENSTKDTRSIDGNSSNKHDKGVNVQVILRCRPLSEDEIQVNTPVMISCNELTREVTAVQNTGSKQIDKTFVFDKAFGPTSKQRDLYEQVVNPIVNEVLEGYNCTIFAYGQTGTGKTYTMEGEGRKEKNGEFHKEAGVIPRAVQQIFDILEAQNTEYNMKVTFIEIYNEDITDLLALDESSKNIDERIKKPITLLEDGKGAIFVRGIEEEIVYTADQIHKILDKGSARKHTADTLNNKQSNRSHSMFTITVQMKECTSEGVELIKCGKLNLVDLAGSENILRSGAREGRAREAGEINKSLLTLGRVINALVEHSGHVPYRDSKLTRLLRDSLGGRTKTCIIATISPSVNCSEETFSTLEYAYRAKNIKNRPEVNQKVIKSEVIKDLYTEIDRLKQELHATREKNGVYIPRERYLNEEAAKKTMTEKLRRMELDSVFKDKQLMKLQDLYLYQQQLTTELTEKFERTKKEFEQTEQALFDLEDKYRYANETIKEREYLIFNLLGSEKALTERAFELRVELENAASEVSSLFAKLEHKNNIEDGNKFLIKKFNTQLAQQMEVLHKAVAASVTQQQQQLKVIQENTRTFLSQKEKTSEELRSRVRKLKDVYGYGIKSLVDLACELDGTSQLTFGNIKSEVSKHSSSLSKLIGEISSEANAIVNDLESNLYNQEQSISTFAQQQHENRLRTYETTQLISRVTVNFFKNVSTYVSKVTQMVEEAQRINEQKLYALEKKYEDYADNEERQLLDKMAELVASSNARKKMIVQTVAHDHRDCTNSTATKLYKEMSELQDFTSSAQEEWTGYMEEMEKHYIEDFTAVETGKDGLGGGLRHCMTKAIVVAEQWKQVEESCLSLQRLHINSMDSILQGGLETNQIMYTHMSSLASTTLEEADTATKTSISSIDYLLRVDHDASEKINSLVDPCHEDMREMQNSHLGNIVKIAENAEKCLINEYVVDETLCSTPRKREFNLPSRTSIEQLRTPSFEELLKKFRGAESGKQENGDVNKSSGSHL